MNTVELIQWIEHHLELFKGRRRDQAYPRYFLFNLLRDRGLTYHQIGEIFGRTHATVIHGHRVHQDFDSIDDQLYLEHTRELRLRFEQPVTRLDLAQDVLHCHDIRSLRIIQNRIRKGRYGSQGEPI